MNSITQETLFCVVGKIQHSETESWIVQLSPHYETKEKAEQALKHVQKRCPEARLRAERYF